ncbi:hypothetical protein OBBRIDRAFT_795785 [Obba rivulosa]|uniref:Uncharacterized protein n=1 Tax=Obba rivulosa TaxID=1052685 RepID=A0A8E2ATI7_9APHY|nr:hypothetical protein OBBRIDRAFT_795785 [Obba rivulosa]
MRLKGRLSVSNVATPLLALLVPCIPSGLCLASGGGIRATVYPRLINWSSRWLATPFSHIRFDLPGICGNDTHILGFHNRHNIESPSMEYEKATVDFVRYMEGGDLHLAESATHLEIAKTFGCTPKLLELWHVHDKLVDQRAMLAMCLQENPPQEWILAAASAAFEFQCNANSLRKCMKNFSSTVRTKAMLDVSESGCFDMSDVHCAVSETANKEFMEEQPGVFLRTDYLISRDLYISSDVTFELSPTSTVFTNSPVEPEWDSWSLGAASMSPCESLDSETASQCTAGHSPGTLPHLGGAHSTSQELHHAYMIQRAHASLGACIPPDDVMEC